MYVVRVMVAALSGTHLLQPGEPMAIPLLAAIDVRGREVKRVQMRRVGDSALLLCGWWWERTYASHGPDLAYYTDIGRAAYRFLAVTPGGDPLAKELSWKFRRLTDALARMAGATGSFDDEDVCRVFRLWMASNSGRAKDILAQHGVMVGGPLH